MRSLLLLLFVVAAQPLLACKADRLDISPARPAASDEIEVVVSGGCPDGCIPHTPRVRLSEGTVTIDLEWGGACILIPQPWGERVALGRLPAGTWQLVVRRATTRAGETEELARRTVVVREDPFDILPSFGSEGTEVLIDRPALPAMRTVTFGGVEAGILWDDGNQAAVKVPAHAPGLVDVVVTGEDGTKLTAKEAFLYPAFDADLTAEHERVFFPSVFAGAGAHGSLWTSRNTIRNIAPVAIDTISPLGALAPGQRVSLPSSNRDGGQFVMVPRGVEHLVAYSSHIVDESRRQTDAGTELPVVHERDTSPNLHLLDVPLTSESRQTLRVFDFDAVPGRVVTLVFDVDGRDQQYRVSTVLGHRIVCVRAPCYPEHPTYAVVNLDSIPELRGAGTTDISIHAGTSDVPLWAYITVTNNDTQHVTTYTPQHLRRPLP